MIERLVISSLIFLTLSCGSASKIRIETKVTQEINCEIGRIKYTIQKEKDVYKMRLTFHKKRGIATYIHPVKKNALLSGSSFIKKGTRLYFKCNYRPDFYISQRLHSQYLGKSWNFTFYFQPEDKCDFSQFFYFDKKVFEFKTVLDEKDMKSGKMICSFGEYEMPS